MATPTATPVLRHTLTINGRKVFGEETFVTFTIALVKVAPAPDADGAYTAGTVVTLVALPRTGGTPLAFTGVDSQKAGTGTVRMTGDRSLEVMAGTAAPTPTPTAAPTAIPVLVATPAPAPTPTPVFAGTATPTAAPTPTPTITPTPVPGATPTPTPTPTSKPNPTPTPSATPAPSPTPAVLPDLIVELLFPPTTVDCSGGAGACTMRVDMNVTNTGTATATGSIVVLIQLEGVGDWEYIAANNLGPGQTTGGIFATLGPGANCFNLACTVTLTVDPHNAIPESDETNNSATRTDEPPDLTVELLYAPSVIDCSGGPSSCTLRVDLQINNIGAGISPSGVEYLVQAEELPDLTLSIGGGGEIYPGGTTGGFFVTLGPGGNCFNPDCTVTVTVDPDNELVESNETNNTATRTDPG